jgi:hypothetical protein
MSGNDDGKRVLEVLDLPDTLDLASVDAAEVVVIRMAAQRRLDVREALCFSRMLEHRRRAIGDVTLEAMMKAVEDENDIARGGQ